MTIIWCVLLVLGVCCVDCILTTYRAPNNLTCFLCEPGTYFMNDCSADYQRAVCSPCPTGSYIPDYNQARYCQPCSTVCPSTNYESADEQPEIKTANCSSTADIKCECRPGFWRESGVHGMCRRVKDCKVGHGVTAVATGFSDTVCEPCEVGQTFSNKSSANDACLPCTICYGHLYVKDPCEPDRDTECIPITSTGRPKPQVDNQGLTIGLGIGLSVPLAAAIAIILICCCYKRKRNNDEQAGHQILNADVERQTYIRGSNVGNYKTASLEAVYADLSEIIPARECKMYFRQLKIDECTIQQIETDHQGSVREQCYQLFIAWERMRKNINRLSHMEWSLELIRKLKKHIDELLKDMPAGLKNQCHCILDSYSNAFTKKVLRLNGASQSVY